MNQKHSSGFLLGKNQFLDDNEDTLQSIKFVLQLQVTVNEVWCSTKILHVLALKVFLSHSISFIIGKQYVIMVLKVGLSKIGKKLQSISYMHVLLNINDNKQQFCFRQTDQFWYLSTYHYLFIINQSLTEKGAFLDTCWGIHIAQ